MLKYQTTRRKYGGIVNGFKIVKPYLIAETAKRKD